MFLVLANEIDIKDMADVNAIYLMFNEISKMKNASADHYSIS